MTSFTVAVEHVIRDDFSNVSIVVENNSSGDKFFV